MLEEDMNDTNKYTQKNQHYIRPPLADGSGAPSRAKRAQRAPRAGGTRTRAFERGFRARTNDGRVSSVAAKWRDWSPRGPWDLAQRRGVRNQLL